MMITHKHTHTITKTATYKLQGTLKKWSVKLPKTKHMGTTVLMRLREWKKKKRMRLKQDPGSII